MKSFGLILLIFCLVPVSVSYAIDDDNPDHVAIEALLEQRIEATNNADIPLFESIYVEDSADVQWFRENAADRHAQGVKQCCLNIYEITVTGDEAYARFSVKGKKSGGSYKKHKAEALFVKVNGEWKIDSTSW